MRYVKILSLAAVTALAMMALGAGSALATTLEVGGTPKNESVTYTESVKPGTSVILRDTFFISTNTCTGADTHWESFSPWDLAKIGLTRTVLTLSNCDNSITVHNAGSGSIEHIAGTTNGRVYSAGMELTVFSAIHNTYITCTTAAAGTLIGTLTGVKEGNATMDLNATLNCGEHLSSAKLTGTKTITTPSGKSGLGVSS